MGRFYVTDTSGREVVLEERTSVVLTAMMVLGVVAAVASAIATVYLLATEPVLSIAGFVALIASLIYTVVFNHLRKKGDMNVGKASFKAVDGRVVTVVKKSSLWITLGVAAYVVVALLGIAAIAVGLYLGGELAAGLVGLGITILVVALIAVAALNFLRTKIDFEGDSVEIKTSRGSGVVVYKRRSFWIALAMVISVIIAIMYFAYAAIQLYTAFVGGVSAIPTTIVAHRAAEVPVYAEYLRGLQQLGTSLGYLSPVANLVAGLLMLINAAILNFLRVRGHVKPSS